MKPFKKVGVIGAGVMGCGVAQDLALSGVDVQLIDVSSEILNDARDQILRNVRLFGMLDIKKRVENLEQFMSKIHFSTNYDDLENVDYVIENATESWDIKKSIYEKIDKIVDKSCIFAANTSAISITKLASIVDRKDRIIGIHFMNPVPLKSTVEVIRGFHTSEQTLSETKDLLSWIGKETVVVKDWPGFVSNRVLMLTINEAAYLVQDQVAPPKDIDKIFKGCFEHKMGPLETADMIGLDTILMSIQVLHDSFCDSKYRPCPLLVQMVDAGQLGRKSGSGFYDYK